MSILAFVHSDQPLRALDGGDPAERLRFCATPDELVRGLSLVDVRAVVIDVDLWPAWATPMLARASRIFCAPLWLRLDPSQANFDKLVSLVRLRSVSQVSLRTAEPGASWLAECLERPLSATIPALRDLQAVIPEPCQNLFAALLVFAEQSAPESTVAAGLAISPRELRRRLKKAGFPTFPTAMGTLFALHAAWRLSELTWSTKRASAAAGCVSAKQLENRLRSHVALTPRQLRLDRGYRRVLDQVGRWFPCQCAQPESFAMAESEGSLAGVEGTWSGTAS